MNRSLALYPTAVTPFNNQGEIEYASLDRLFHFFAAQGCDGVFAVCQSSEMFFLSDEEKLELSERSIRLCRETGMRCVVSGHTQDTLPAQIDYLKKLEKQSPDAIILVSNRLAKENESDETAIGNLQAILSALSPKTRLGIYECPYPYKRLLSGPVLDRMMESGRFDFIKDTCCNTQTIKERLGRIAKTDIRLYNANAATLTETFLAGAAGYSGVMLNMIPEIFALLKQSYGEGNLKKAEKIASYISCASVIEYQNYPVNAKYMLFQRGIFSSTVCRNGKPQLTESQRLETEAFMRCGEMFRAVFS